jgi:hypothetical protein
MSTHVTAVHGSALQTQNPLHVRRSDADAPTTADEPLAALARFGWGTEVRGNRYPAWLHIALPIDSHSGPVTVREIGVRFSTRGGGVLTAVHAWDGHQRVAYNDHVDAPPLVTSGGNRIRQEAVAYLHQEHFGGPFRVAGFALGVSLQWTFATAIDSPSTAAVTFHSVTATYDAAD